METVEQHATMNISNLLEGAEIVSASEYSMVAKVDGVEVCVSPQIRYSGCSCCGHSTELHASYNRFEEDRIEDHGEADPLGLE